jgi:hypothetical protein
MGPITSFHFLTDIGFNVIKPDRVLMRIFFRLGLVQSETDYVTAIIVGRRFSEATGYPIRYIDIIFVSYGQIDLEKLTAICTTVSPKCHLCGVSKYCHYNNGMITPINKETRSKKVNINSKNKKASNYIESNSNLLRFEEVVNQEAIKLNMVVERTSYDFTLFKIKGGKTTLYFSIRPKKMVSVWQINKGIVDQIKLDLIPFNLKSINLPLNRRIIINLNKLGIPELDLIRAILNINKLFN